jgi:hypothetical protein
MEYRFFGGEKINAFMAQRMNKRINNPLQETFLDNSDNLDAPPECSPPLCFLGLSLGLQCSLVC